MRLKETDIEIIKHTLPIRELVLFACGVQQEGVGDYAAAYRDECAEVLAEKLEQLFDIVGVLERKDDT